MTSIGSSNISLSGIKANYVAGAQSEASGNLNLRDGNTNSTISFSYFRGSLLTESGSTHTVDTDSDEEISINNDFKDKTIFIPVTDVNVSVVDSTPNESTTVSNYCTGTIIGQGGLDANGTLLIDYSTQSIGGATANPSSSGYQSATAGSNTMTYSFSSTPGINKNVGQITVTVKQNGSVVDTGTSPSDIIIQETGGCFDISTLVHMSDGTTKSYGELLQGDIVKSYSINGFTETDDSNIYLNEEIPNIIGTETTSIVQSISILTADSYYLINNSLKITDEHPLMVKRDDVWKWRRVKDIQQYDKMYNINNGETIISSIEKVSDTINIASINVSDVNTYFAGDILAHNK